MSPESLARLISRWEMRAACDSVYEAAATWQTCADELKLELEASDV